MFWPFKAKKKTVDVTFLKMAETLGPDTLRELEAVMRDLGIHIYTMKATGAVPGTGLLLSKHGLSMMDLAAAERKLIEIELSSIDFKYKA